MKFKNPVSVFILCISVSFLFWNCSPQDAPEMSEEEEEVYHLQMATFWPSSAFQVAEGHAEWIEKIETRSGGQVKIDLHAGEALLGAREIYEGVTTGVADIGSTCPAYTPGIFPLFAAFELPGYHNDNALVASMTVQEGYRKIKEELGIDEFEEVKVLFFFATGPGNLMTTDPIKNLEDMEGKTIRSVGGTVASLEILGATPVSMPMSEAYLALDQRIVQGLLAPNEVLSAFRLSEVVNYLTKTPFLYNVVFVKIMNKDTWNSLPPDIQEVFNEVNEESVKAYGELLTQHTRAGLQLAVDEHDLDIIELSEDEEKRWLNRLSTIVEDWIHKTEEDNLPAGEAVEIIQLLDEKFSEEYRDF